MILVGSWCVHFYKDYFDGAALSAIRTRDMDFLIPPPSKIKKDVHVAELLKDLGFISEFHGNGSVSLSHPELIISGRRAHEAKAMKDRLQVVEVLREVISRGGAEETRTKFRKLPSGWRKAVLSGLKAAQADDLAALLA